MHCLVAAMSVWLLLASLLVSVPSAAQEDGAPVVLGAYRVIESQVLNETRHLLVHLPRGYEGSAIAYPVLYHTYGSNLTSYYTDAVGALEALGNDASAPQMILVGIDNIDRYRDLLPVGNRPGEGRAENYARFLAEEVFPFVEANYRTAEYRILAGPQAGAVFGLDGLLIRPDDFDAYILNNPFASPQNVDHLLGLIEPALVDGHLAGKFCHVTFGDRTERPAATAHVYDFADRVAGADGFELVLEHALDSDAFIPPLRLREGLAALFEPYRVPEDAEFSDLVDLERFYADLSARYSFDVAPSEFTMTMVGDRLRRTGHVDAAVEIFERQSELYPGALNAWWQLAGIAAERGEMEEAVRLLRRCEEIDPKMTNIVDRRIRQLKGSGELSLLNIHPPCRISS